MSRHRSSRVALALIYCALVAAGEGLHLLPGMGHYVESPSGACLWFGAQSECCPLTPGDWCAQGVHVPDGPQGQLLDTDECAICSLLALVAQPALPAMILPAEALTGETELCFFTERARRRHAPYPARGPPAFFANAHPAAAAAPWPAV